MCLESVTEEQMRKDLIQTRGSRSVKATEKESGFELDFKRNGKIG